MYVQSRHCCCMVSARKLSSAQDIGPQVLMFVAFGFFLWLGSFLVINAGSYSLEISILHLRVFYVQIMLAWKTSSWEVLIRLYLYL